MKKKTHNFNSFELFSGAGGIALGLHRAGFRHTGLVEFNPHAVKTLRLNCEALLEISPDMVHHTDARTFTYSKLEGRIDLLAGGPPCQPFSTGGKNLAQLDPRDMFPTFLRAVREVRPKAILIENVRGILRERFSSYFGYITKRLEFPFCLDGEGAFENGLARLELAQESDFRLDEQYHVHHQLIDTADYGIPQRRERVLIVAFRKDLGVFPSPLLATHSKASLLRTQYITGEYWARHGIKPQFFLGKQTEKIISQLKQNTNHLSEELKLSPWLTVRDCISDLPPAAARGQREQQSNHVQHPGARTYPGHMGSYHDYPAKALKAGTHGTPGGENMLRVNNTENVRYFTTREAARLQTFPDEWKFNGETWGSCITQLGNAVPVEIARIWGEKIKIQLQEMCS